jgi:hypothetical protein
MRGGAIASRSPHVSKTGQVIASGRSVHGAICRGDGIDKARAAEQWHGLGRQLRRHGTGIAERRAKGQPPNPWLGRQPSISTICGNLGRKVKVPNRTHLDQDVAVPRFTDARDEAPPAALEASRFSARAARCAGQSATG